MVTWESVVASVKHHRRAPSLVLKYLLAAVFLFAGFAKLFAADQSALAPFLPLVPAALAGLAAQLAPWLEIGIGLLLLSGAFHRPVTGAAAAMSLAFLAVNSVAIAQGSTSSCGCLGDAVPLSHWQSLGLNMFMIASAGVLLWKPPPRLALRPAAVRRVARPLAAAVFAILLVVTQLPGQARAAEPQLNTDSGTLAPVSAEFLDFINTRPIRPASPSGPGLPTRCIPYPMDKKAVSGAPTLVPSAPLGVMPASFDLRNVGGVNKVTPVKNQDPCGTCWAFGTISSLEGRVLFLGGGTFDLSEQNLVTCADQSWTWINPDHCNGGGNIFISSNTLIQKGSRLESAVPYNGATINAATCNSTPPVQQVVTDWRAIAWDGVASSAWTPIKQAIYTYGVVNAAYYHSNTASYWNTATPTYGYVYDNPGYPNSGNSNHLISIVGWNDLVPHPHDGGSGAWLVKNSWDTDWGGSTSSGHDGYFWLAYGSACLGDVTAFYGGTGTTSGYINAVAGQKTYYWDDAGEVTDYGWTSSTYGWMANTFSPTTAGNITHVGFWAANAGATYQLYVYNGGVTSGQVNIPGTLLAGPLSGTCAEGGYYTIPLATPIARTAGQTFTVAAKITTPGYNYPIPISTNYWPTYANPTIHPGVSWMKHGDANTWYDASTTASGVPGGVNVGIRAIVQPATSSPAPSNLTATPASSSQINLAWTDNATTETGFKVDRAPDASGSPGTWAQIATPAANATSYNDTGLSAGTKYHYRVKAVLPGGDTDPSNTTSATTSTPSLPPITVTSPNGGESWVRGTSHNITWTYTGSPGANVKIDLMKGGVLNRVIVTSTPIGTSGSGTYSWTIASDQATGTDYKVKVTSTATTSATDSSDANFSITAAPLAKIAFTSSRTAGAGAMAAGAPVEMATPTGLGAATLQDEIWVMNADGTSPTRLTSNSTSDVRPTWSPDASHIVYASWVSDAWQVYVMNADGTGQTAITSGTSNGYPAISPSGAKIAFWSSRDGTPAQVYVMNSDGSGQTRLTLIGTANTCPAWSPDSTKIAFQSNRGDGLHYDIYSMNADGGGQTRLTEDTGNDTYPAWSPDGTKIAFVSDRLGDQEIFVMNADGSVETRLTSSTGEDTHPWWTPDSKIGFASARSGNLQLYVMNADGTGVTRLTTNTATDDFPAYSAGSAAPPAASIGLSVPNGGESWQRGTTQTIRWGYTGSPGANVKIELLKGGAVNRTIIASTPLGSSFTGSYAWAIPADQETGTDYKVRVTSTTNSSCTDTSDANFSIMAAPPSFLFKWGSTGAGDGQFQGPTGVAADASGNVYVADGNRIQKFSSTGAFITKWGSFGTGDGQFEAPVGVAVDSSGHVYVVEKWNSRVQKFSSAGAFVTKWGTEGTGDGQFAQPMGIAVDSEDNVYVADAGNNRIQKFTGAGVFVIKWGSGGTGDGQFDIPVAIAIDGLGNVFVADQDNQRVQRFSSTGVFSTKWGSAGTAAGQFGNPDGIGIDSSGNVYVAEYANNRVQKFTGGGGLMTMWGTAGTGNSQFDSPWGVAVGPGGIIYVADSLNNRMQVFGTPVAPAVTTTAATGVGDVAATLNGTLTLGTNHDAQVSFEYGTTLSYGSTTPPVVREAGGAFSTGITTVASTSYNFRSKAVTASGTVYGANQTFRTTAGPPPAAPSGLTLTVVSSTRIDLDWDNNAPSATGYKIQRAPDSGGSPGTWTEIGRLTSGATTTYSNTRLTANTTYWYRVCACNLVGDSAFCASVSASTLPPPPPVPALNSPASSATVTTLTPALSWTATTGAVHWNIQVATSSAFTTLLIGINQLDGTTYTVGSDGGSSGFENALEWAHSYYWRVSAENAGGSASAWTTGRMFRTSSGPPPNPPSNLAATTFSATQINLTWDDNSTNETGFKIERAPDVAGAPGTWLQIAQVVPNTTTYASTRLTTATTYWYRVRSYSLAGASACCTPDSATTLPPPPSVPALLTPAASATVSTLTPVLDWDPSTLPAGSGLQLAPPPITYGIQVSESSTFATLKVNQAGLIPHTYTVLIGEGLEWAHSYYWRVNARGAAGSTSNWSTGRMFRTGSGPPPADPSGLTATPLSGSRIDLTWTDNATNETGFKVERSANGGATWLQIAQVGPNILTYSNATGLSVNTTYSYRVRAYSLAGNSGYSAPATATTGPAAPTLTLPLPAKTGVLRLATLQWTAPPAGAASFDIRLATDPGFTAGVINVTGVAANNYTFAAPLAPNTRYYWKVIARSAIGTPGNWSLSRYFTTGP